MRCWQHGLDSQANEYRVAHEQAISHRLAFYIEAEFRRVKVITDKGPIVVDCEYSQHLFDRKMLCVLKGEAEPFLRAKRSPIPVPGRDLFGFEIRPDILVHQRGTDGPTNLLVLEVKRWTNSEKQHDSPKLRLLTRPGPKTFSYVLGAALYARNDFVPERRVLEVGLRFHAGLPC